MATQDTFVEPAASQRYRYDETGAETTYAELVKDIDPELRPKDENGYKLFLDILGVVPID